MKDVPTCKERKEKKEKYLEKVFRKKKIFYFTLYKELNVE